MTSLLSSISGQFGKSIFMGAMFPVLIVAVLNGLLTVPLLPSAAVLQGQFRDVIAGKDTWGAILFFCAIIFVTGVLYNLNIPIIRMYEGYPWRQSWLGGLAADRKRKAFTHAGPLRLSLRYLRRQLQAANPDDSLASELQAEQNRLARYLNSELPDRVDLVLPTRFGNVIRCFERYSDVAYGIDAIIVWPRLVAKIEPAFASTIDEAKTSVDFMINSSLLCAISAVTPGLIGLCQPYPWSAASVWHWGWRTCFFFAFSLMFYSFAIGRAVVWGEQVKSAFDLYRFDLLKALGYDQQPSTYFEEKALWDRICIQLLYADSRERPVPYKGTSPRVSASPVGVRLEVQRTMAPTAINGISQVKILINNKDARSVEFIVLYETPPDGCKFILDSAAVTADPVGAAPNANLFVRNIAPLELRLEQLAGARRIVVTYEVRTIIA